MPPEMQTEVRHHAEHLERNEGLTADESIDRALETIAETEEGQKVIDQAVQGIVDDVNSGRIVLPILGNIEPYSAPAVTEPVAAVPTEPAAEVPVGVPPVTTPTAALPEPVAAVPTEPAAEVPVGVPPVTTPTAALPEPEPVVTPAVVPDVPITTPTSTALDRGGMMEQDKDSLENKNKIVKTLNDNRKTVFGQPPATDVETVADKQKPQSKSEPDTSQKAEPEVELKQDAPHIQIANFAQEQLNNGERFNAFKLFDVATKAFQGKMSEGKYTPKDAYDAMELGVNMSILKSDINLDVGADEAKRNLARIERMLTLIPTQTKRTEEQDEFQQFSTPPNLAYVTAWVANIGKDDVVMEPSAGVGGLAVFAKKAGAKVVVNELSKRRLELLKELDFDHTFNENAEQIDNILPADIKPTVVIMNPPFSATAGRIKGKKSTKFSTAHIEQVLSRLEPNGRVVMIVGKGMADNAPSFRKWWDEIKQKYNVRVNIGINGKNYKKYGTSFDVQLVVIDNTGSTTEPTATGKFTDLEDAISFLEVIKNDRVRQVKQSISERAGEVAPEEGRGEARPGSIVPVSTPEVGIKEQRSEDRGRDKQGRVSRPPERDRDAIVPGRSEKSDEVPDGGKSSGVDTVGKTEGTEGRGGVPVRQDKVGADRGRLPGTDTGVKAEAKEVVASKEELSNSVYSPYTPQKLKIPGAQKHPGPLVQSAAMAAVEPPTPTYTPNLPEEVVKYGKLSIAQLEAVVYAGQSHGQILPDGQRRGFFIGDGTGVGKGREISGIILDNMRQGRKKAVWISKNNELFKDAKRDFGNIGGDTDLLFPLKKIKLGTPIKQKGGILFTTYHTLASGLETTGEGAVLHKEGKKARIAQLVEWLGEDFDGVIAFDEAHFMQNSLSIKSKRGISKPATMALAGVELQRRLPNARVVYVSATGATEVHNLAYVDRLGLWGEGTAFADKNDFVNKIQAGGLAAMELVARDMKAMGVYIARSLSYEGVTYGTLEHKLTETQREIYDAMAKGWQIVLQNMHKALDITRQAYGGRAKGNAAAQFWSAQQRFFNQILTSMQMPSVIKQVEEDLKNGRAVVLQLVNTNEAIQNRAIAKLEDESLEDLDLTPRDILMQYLDKSFPTQQYEVYTDKDGNERTRPVIDSHGNQVHSREALAMKEELMSQIGALKVPDGPLELILNNFGPENVAEITGRRQRVIRVKDSSGRIVVKKESRTKSHVEADVDSFMNGKKQILVFSDAGGTGKSYHADLTAKNQRPRVHYLIQAGWRANNAVQGFGRTHRTNQASAPHYVLVTTNLKGQKRFISSIARRLDQLGALTKGQRQAGSQGLFSAKDNLESEIARGALWRFYMDLVDGQLKQLGDINAQELLRKMGMENLLDKHQNLKEDPALRDITKFLNRLLTLESDLQNRVFDAFWNVFEAIVEAARKRGDLDVGLENFRADKVEVKDEKTVYTEEKSGAETKYVELEASYKIEPLPFNEAIKLSRFNGFYRNTRSGRIYARRISGEKTLPNGDIVLIYELHGQSKDNVNTVDLPQFERGNWEKVDDAEAVKLWQEAQDKLPEYSTQKVHLITGALLPIWDRLTQERVRVIRVKTDSGRVMLGRIIPPRSIDETLRRLEVQRKTKEHSPGELVDLILNNDYTVYLANGWKISRRRVSGEHRIEVTGNDLYHYANQLEQEGVFRERINYATRFFIPAGDNATKILGNVIKHRPVLDVVAPRDEAQAMARPATSPKLKKKDATKETIRRRDIVKFLDSKFAPIRTGRFRRKSLGIFKIKPEVIRTRLANDLPVICHEIGHYLDKKLNLADPAYDQELLNLGEPQSKKSYTKEQVRKEGVAEFMRLYLTEPETAKQEAPNYYAAFENKIEAYDDIKDSLLTARADIELWYTQPAAARVAGAISVGESNRRKMSLSSIYTLTIDESHPLKGYVEQIGAKNLPIHKDPFKLAWLARGWAGKARTLLYHGVLDANGKKIGKSLAEVLKPVSKELDNFRNYIVAKHSLEVTAQGKITGILDEDAQKVVDAAPDKYQKVLKDLVEYQDALMKLLVDSEVMSADAAKKMREMYPNYVPFYRLFEEDVNTIAAYMSKGGFANLRNPVKMMKGSTREILDPLESIVKNTYLFVNIAERNSVGRAIVELAESKEGSGRFVEKVDTRYNVAKDNILTIYRDGKAEKYQLEPDLYRATLMLDKDAANILVKILSYPASWLRAGATLSPDFMVRNPLRDQYSAFVNSKYGYIPGVDLIRGIFHYLKKDDLYWQFMNSGAASATLVSLDRDYLQKNVKELLKNKSKQEKILTALNPKEWANSFIEMLRELSEMGEYGTRIGEFAKGIRSGADPAEAALSARDVTLDFGRMGTHTKQANRIIAFMNATVQGMDKMRRQFIEKPLQTTLRAVISITLPSVLLFLANHDDDRYKELPQWQKDLFWIILTENNIYRIPKPFEMGILFGSVPERVLAWILENDPKAFDGLGKTISEAALPGYIPTAMIPIIEAFANKSYFTGRPIVPQREEKLEPRYQYGPYTTETAKSIGNILNLSPRMIENYIRGYTGGLGMYSIKFAEGIGEVTGIMGDTSKPSLSASEYPVLKAFMAKEYISSQSVQDFYDELNELERKYATTNQTGKAHITLKEHARLKKLRKVAGKFSDIRKVEREILGSETLMPEQKKAALDRANLLMVNMAREALGRRKVQ
jgi:tRNA G10  N-methylase Trm11